MRRKLFLIFLLCTFAFNISAREGQNNAIDTAITAQIDSLQKIADNYLTTGDYNKAIKHYTQALNIIKKTLGNEHLYYAISLSYIGDCYLSLTNYNKAIDFYTQAFDIYLKNEHHYIVESLKVIGECYFKLEVYNSAIEYNTQILQILDKEDPYYVESLITIALCYSELEEYNNAIKYYKQALQILDKEHPYYATFLSAIGKCYTKLEDYNSAIEYYKQALQILNKEHPNYAFILSHIAMCFYHLELYNSAIEYNKNAIKLFKNNNQIKPQNYTFAIINQATFYAKIESFNNALNYYNEALNLTQKEKGSNHPDYALILSQFAICLSDFGDYKNALEYHKNAIAIFENTKDRKLHDYATIINNLACCLSKNGNYNLALKYHIEALNIRNIALGKEHPDYAISLNNIGACYDNLGDDNKAIEYYNKALNIHEKTKRQEHSDYAMTLSNIGNCYIHLGNYTKALEYHNNALNIYKSKFGENHSDYILSLNNLGQCFSEFKNYNKAIEYYTEAIKLLENNIEKEHPIYALLFNNIGFCHSNLGDYNKAIEYYSQAIEIKNKILGKEHPDYQLTLQNIACTHLLNHNKAFSETSKEFTKLNIASICKTFVDLSLNERKLFWDKHSFWYANIIHQGVCDFNDASLLPSAYNSVLFSKGLLLNAEIAMRDLLEESNDPATIELYNELLSTRSILNKQYELALEKRYISTDSLEKRADELEHQLINTSKVYGDYTRNLQLRWTDVQNHLSDKDIAIEFASFSHNDSTTYLAYILKKGYKTPAYKKILTHNNDENLNNSEIYLSVDFSKTLWGTLSEELKGVENIYFAPAGELYNIAIESLPYWESPTTLVSDKWNFFRLSSTRELALNKEKFNSKSATVYGGLKYNTATNQLGTTDEFNYNPLDIDAIGLRSGVEYLPGSHSEAVLIDKLLKSNKIYNKLYLGEAGTETTLKALGGEKINMLHIATHGFYWTEREARRMDFQFLNNQNKNVEDKMLSRSGLLFSGANNILSGKEIPENIDDGVLTAEEISRIDLRGLDLIVLSACQSGLGEISGEGVFGLQRGFKKAGTQSILMSLWNVDDKATQLFMSKFYELLLTDKDNPGNKRNAHLKAQQFVKNYEIDLNSISSQELKYYKENGAVINYNIGKVKPFSNHRFWAAFILLDAI